MSHRAAHYTIHRHTILPTCLSHSETLFFRHQGTSFALQHCTHNAQHNKSFVIFLSLPWYEGKILDTTDTNGTKNIAIPNSWSFGESDWDSFLTPKFNKPDHRYRHRSDPAASIQMWLWSLHVAPIVSSGHRDRYYHESVTPDASVTRCHVECHNGKQMSSFRHLLVMRIIIMTSHSATAAEIDPHWVLFLRISISQEGRYLRQQQYVL